MTKSVIEINVNKENPVQIVNDTICEKNDLSFIFAANGQKIKTFGPNSIKTHFVEENGDIICEMETKYNTETFSIANSNVDMLSASIQSFDDDSVTLIVSYPDHESKRLFKKSMRNKLETMGLLKIGMNFYLHTKENQNGFSINIVPMRENYDKVTNDLFDEYIKAQRENNA